MKLRTLLVVALLLPTLPACMVHSRIDLGPAYGPPAPSPTPGVQAQETALELVCDENCTKTEKAKIKLVQDKVNETLASACFQDYMTAPERRFNMLDGKSPWDVVQIMRRPAIMLVNYYSSLQFWVLGFEVGGESVVHLNRVAIAYHRFDICDEASIAVHEASHAKGFMHRGNSPDDYNQRTVPYTLNHAFDQGPGNGGCCKP